ncbi:MAG TPA: DUF3298/DUF4163 domain-containing protein [Lachnoclostridium sp.]|jgi:hypothetical protein|uniref:DUF3298 and DUF4163 domain-containing protein n=1 Tax=Lacrimispora sp. TaxID=2719234 RepID=UPI000EF0E0F2|nr:DUF3298 and DUF4163 domain-containing protein [Lacrimispora sp.]HCD43498.1 DUF3298/DUF4163 domain-containing protein [Lachnoclostridium sp.]
MQTISKKTLTDIMRHNGITVFTYTIHYPYFTTTCSSTSAQSINKFYEFRSKQAENYCRTVLYPQAVDQAMFVQKNQFPFNSYEFLSVYQVTYNKDCTSSLYTDQYTYLGGAHGNTTRDSQTWDFSTGKQLNLIDFFPNTPQFTDYIFKGIQQQIEEQTKTSPSQYFDDYAALLRGNFNINGFFLKPSGVVIYYQQYDIAPYVRGIPEFLFPFQDCGPNV